MTDLVPDTYPLLRWACDCGRFVAESAIRSTDYRDPLSYYGVSTRTEYDCSRCGVVGHMPRLIEVGEAHLPAVEAPDAT